MLIIGKRNGSYPAMPQVQQLRIALLNEESLAFSDRLSAVKGMQYIQDMPDFGIPLYRSELAFTRMLADNCPTIRAKNDLMATGAETAKVGYPVVSFLGNLGLDRLAGRIRSIRCTSNIEGNTGVILFAYIIRGRCYVSICTNVIDDSWKTGFIGILLSDEVVRTSR